MNLPELTIELQGSITTIIGIAIALRIFEPSRPCQWIYNELPKHIRQASQYLSQHIKNTMRSLSFDNEIKPKHDLGAFGAWGFMTIFILFTVYFLGLGFTLMSLIALKSLSAGDALMPITALGFLFCLCLIAMASWYRACAYKVARENGINLTPWRQIFSK